MFKKIFLFLLIITSAEAENLSSILTQRGGTHNAIFLNPAKLASQNNNSDMKVNLINTSLSLTHKSFTFLKELKSATSASNKNREISQLLKKNIGNTLSFSATNFSSLSQTQENLSWSLGIANTLDGYFITHSGFGSKGAMESFIEKYKALIGTLSLKKEYIDYGINIKVIEKMQTIHNYSINEMVKNSSFTDYFDSKNMKKESTLGVDMGILYTLPYRFNPQLSFSILNIGNSSFKDMDSLPYTTNIGFLLTPYENTSIQFDYIDLFQHQKNQNFEDSFRANINKYFLRNHLKINFGILENRLAYGAEYKYKFFNIALNSFNSKTYQKEKEQRYELSLGISW